MKYRIVYDLYDPNKDFVGLEFITGWSGGGSYSYKGDVLICGTGPTDLCANCGKPSHVYSCDLAEFVCCGDCFDVLYEA